jgi:hypothetical protein
MRFHTYQELLIRYENDNNTETQHDSARKAKIVKDTIRAEDIRANFVIFVRTDFASELMLGSCAVKLIGRCEVHKCWG